jgi:hypothetical protein
MRLKHITPYRKRNRQRRSSCAVQQQGTFALLVVLASAKIAAKTNKQLGALETRLELGLKKSMMVGRS